jgi:OmpA-OmpF porin, OOP family
MACRHLIVALVLAGCAGANTKTVCTPVPSFQSPAVQCVAMAEPPPPPPKPEPPKVEPPPKPEPPPEPPPEPEPPPVVVKKERIELDRTIQFEPYSAKLIEDSKVLLDEVAAVLTKHPEILLVQIEGHTDSKMGTQYNQQLSVKRANAVRAYLIKAGIAKNRLTAKGFGEKKPVGDNNTWKGRFQNRRVDLKITKRAEDSEDKPEKPEKPEKTEDKPEDKPED